MEDRDDDSFDNESKSATTFTETLDLLSQSWAFDDVDDLTLDDDRSEMSEFSMSFRNMHLKSVDAKQIFRSRADDSSPVDTLKESLYDPSTLFPAIVLEDALWKDSSSIKASQLSVAF